MILGYARVSTEVPSLASQIDALTDAGAERFFKEKKTGKSRERSELGRMPDHLRPGDLVMVTKYDRLARSLHDLIDIVENIRESDAEFRSLGDDFDATTPDNRLVFHVFGSIAQFERKRIVEHTKEGLATAKTHGHVGGRPSALILDQKPEVHRRRDEEGRPVSEIARPSRD